MMVAATVQPSYNINIFVPETASGFRTCQIRLQSDLSFDIIFCIVFAKKI